MYAKLTERTISFSEKDTETVNAELTERTISFSEKDTENECMAHGQNLCFRVDL